MVTIMMMIMFTMMNSIDHSPGDNDDDDQSRFHCELIDGVLWVLVGLLFVGPTLLCCVLSVLCIVSIVSIVSIVRRLLVGFGDVASFYSFSRHIKRLSNTK